MSYKFAIGSKYKLNLYVIDDGKEVLFSKIAEEESHISVYAYQTTPHAGDFTLYYRDEKGKLHESSQGDDFTLKAKNADQSCAFATGAGDDTLVGGEGNDEFKPSGGSNKVICGKGDDRVYLGGGDTTISAGEGDDYIHLFKGNVTASGGRGEDTYAFFDRKTSISISDFNVREDTLQFSFSKSIDELDIAKKGGGTKIIAHNSYTDAIVEIVLEDVKPGHLDLDDFKFFG